MAWEVFDESVPFAGRRYGTQRARMVLVGLGDGGLLVVSPGSPLHDDDWTRIAAWGEPRFLLAPNHFHNMGIAPWRERFPNATVVSAPRAMPRLRKKLRGIEVADVATLVAALPPHVRVLAPPGAKQGETWISVRTTRGWAWFVTDAIVNVERLAGLGGLFMRALGFRTRLMANPLFMRLFVEDRDGYRRWLAQQLEENPPSVFVPAHGAVLEGPDLAARLLAAVGEMA